MGCVESNDVCHFGSLAARTNKRQLWMMVSKLTSVLFYLLICSLAGTRRIILKLLHSSSLSLSSKLQVHSLQNWLRVAKRAPAISDSRSFALRTRSSEHGTHVPSKSTGTTALAKPGLTSPRHRCPGSSQLLANGFRCEPLRLLVPEPIVGPGHVAPIYRAVQISVRWGDIAQCFWRPSKKCSVSSFQS